MDTEGLTIFQQWKLGVTCCCYLAIWLCAGLLTCLFGAFTLILLVEVLIRIVEALGGDSLVTGMESLVTSIWGGGRNHTFDLAGALAVFVIPMMARDAVRETVEFCEGQRREISVVGPTNI